MAAKKYPVGTQIRFIGPCHKCKNKIGKITKVDKGNDNGCYIYLPDSLCGRAAAGSFYTLWKHIKPISQKGQQLLFNFMY